ncbi:hypothetical protein [Pendulispora albinea]|uniref:Uncharacterized protein n=1 Tax=Pendulispora albinea TaxID=2741071 RepID=A0ABZ2LVA9_9BACT
MLALIVAWIFGATAFVDGCSVVLYYHGDNVDAHDTVRAIQSDDRRAEAAKAAEDFFTTMSTARHRFFPLSVAGMLLGAVMVAFAARAMSGRVEARAPLIQVVCVHAGLVILAYFLAEDVRLAEVHMETTFVAARMRESSQNPEFVEKVIALMPKVRPLRDNAWLVARTLLSGFIIIALTRSRAREFFEAASGRYLER